jgi:hypothetical protein
MFLVWLFGLWLSFEDPAKLGSVAPGDPKEAGATEGPAAFSGLWRRAWLRLATLAAVLLLLAPQLCWAFVAASRDCRRPYSGSKALAAYIVQEHLAEGHICGFGFHCVAVQPYFRQNMYENWGDKRSPCFWWWSSRTPQGAYMADGAAALQCLQSEQPDLLVIPNPILQNQVAQFAAFDAAIREKKLPYSAAMIFEGEMFWKLGTLEPTAFVAYRRQTDRRPGR